MSPHRYAAATASIATMFAGLFGAVALLAPHPRLLWNATASAPIGLYRLIRIDRPAPGDMVAVTPPAILARFMAERRYLPLGVPLLKHVAARSGARICRIGARVTVNDRIVAIAQTRDSHGRPLPVWRGCHVLATHELLLLNAAPDSMDGRYFGPVAAAGLLGRAIPMLTRDAPDAPLRWRGFGASTHSSNVK